MPLLEDIPRPENGFYVLITGANSGLGLGIGCRLIDEFLQTRPQSQSLVLIITTRSKRKGDDTVAQLRRHLQQTCRKLEGNMPGIRMLLERRVYFRQEILDLTSIISLQTLGKRMRETTPKLDVVICNAGIGGWEGLHWGKAVWTVLTDWKNAVTWPTFKKSGVGWVTKPQIPPQMPTDGNGERKIKEPPLGEVFCANFFGHYLLGHYLASLLAKHDDGEQTRGRLVWVSSLEGYTHSLDLEDIQSLESRHPYESSKRLTDVMGITSTLPSTAPTVSAYLRAPLPPLPSPSPFTATTTPPRIYVAHPGICGTSIMPLFILLDYCMFATFYIARWLGSQWHPVTAYKGACAMVWLALVKQSTLDTMEAREGVGKWGSATDWWGQERVERTEIEGWGWGGTVEGVEKGGKSRRRKGRSPYARDLTKEDREVFEETGRNCWREMERLREEWEKRLDDAGMGIPLE
ncbi:3-keto-steroid reductase [Lindgomyces ingoldianus]|uniref:3-keto-steroid reductase n=1 Tax=Lindgomyces ingoldianus TaxID=673940 RepID=A0ACB6QZ17_9PLEO|nr:3-keto-steroid reductase [Lindgomyces ingoldianus]KAF2471803.1 3-keto-steroid reductase [Lindgomyces ingoldianus]